MKDNKKGALLAALRDARGIITTACEAVGISRETYRNWKNKDPEFRQQAEDIEETQIDMVEGKLLNAIERGDTTAIIFYLKTKGKKRGYSEKAQPTLPPPTVSESPAKQVESDSKRIAMKVKNKKAYIVKLLKEQGKYTAELTYQVEITAQLLVRAEMLGDEILSDGHKVVNVEYSREGNERVTINPKEKLYLEVLEKGQKALRALGMNTESKERKTDNDGFSEFQAAIRMEDDE